MKTRISKWGNSLALRIPQTLARQIALVPGCPVELTLRGHKLTISPIKPSKVGLDDLLRQVTEDNLHSEVDTGNRRGREAW